MRDLHLWRLLRQRELDPAETTPLLEQLAALSFAERAPFFGLLGPALGHADAVLRRVALRALAGANGRPGLQRILQATSDPDEGVRREAVEALRQSVAGRDWSRWVHVLFHPDPVVRRQAIADGASFPPPELYKLYLLPDPACGEMVRRQLADLQIDRSALSLLLDFVRRGLLPVPLARHMCRALSWNDWLGFLGDLVPREYDMTAYLEKAMEPGWPDDLFGHYRPDRLDDLLAFYWDPDPPPEDDEYYHDFHATLWHAALGESPYFHQWLAFTLLGQAAQRGTWPRPVVELLAVLHPPFLTCPWVPLEVRRAGLAGFYRAGSRTPRRPVASLRAIVDSDICRREADGLPDLWAAGAVLHAADRQPFGHLVEWLGMPSIAAGFRADVERSLPLFGVPDSSPIGRTLLIRELCLFEGPQRYRLLARLVQAVPGDALDFLNFLDGAAACQLLDHLLESAGRAFSENKTRRLAEVLAHKIAAGQSARFLAVWLDRPAPEDATLAQSILSRLLHDHGSRHVLPALAGLDTPRLRRFLRVLPFCAGFPYDEEVQLALRVMRHSDGEVREWAATRLREHEAFRAAHEDEDLAEGEQRAALRLGLCAELELRPGPDPPDIDTCQALLASHDPPDQVIRHLTRFLSPDEAFLTRLDVEMVKHWKGEPRLPLLGHVWLYRWDEHRAALGTLLQEGGTGVADHLRASLGWNSWVAARRVWQAMLALLEQWRWHDRPRLEEAWAPSLADALVEGLRTPLADLVARFALHWRDHTTPGAAAELAQLRQRLALLMPEVSEETRRLFFPWIDTRGLGAPVSTPAAEPTVIAEVLDLDVLAGLLQGDDVQAPAAARALLARGEAGWRRLAVAVDDWPAARWPLYVVDRLSDCPSAELRAAMRRLVRNAAAPPDVRFGVGTALWPTGEDGVFDDCVDAVCAPATNDWFRHGDVSWLNAWNPHDQRQLYLRLITSTQAQAYGAAVAYFAESSDPDPLVYQALLDFLEHGTGRMREWRLRAAEWLYSQGERDIVVPLLLSKEPNAQPPHPALLAGAAGPLVLAVTQAVLMAGQGDAAEVLLLEMLSHGSGLWTASNPRQERVDPVARQEAMAEVLANAASLPARQRARKALRSGLGRSHKLRRVAETFAWGVRIGRQLTGRLFALEMIAGEELGYTRLNEHKLYISPLPILRGQQDGREVVRALILHEYGHHLYHKGEEAEAVWVQAEREKLQRLLNLVSDEHLERNLRARDQHFGDQLKKLGAFAFQHTAREVGVQDLLDGLRSQAFAVLTQTPLGVARKPDCVAVHSGRVLLQMERAGLSFARFVRALRMGLGDRHGDDKVRQALELFKGRFREASMPQLLEITRELRQIFGEETELLNTFNQDLVMIGDADDLADAAEGITNEELQAEVRRALEGQGNRRASGGRGVGRGYNRDPGIDFEEITNVVPRQHDPARHASYAQRVARQAERMRRFLQQLGLSLVPRKLRVQGRAFDRARAKAMVLRGDPRVLIAREIRYTTDLFLGVLLDCSGSMAADENIEKAKLFATLLAEAARGLPGVDLRLWGFTDRTIYDCGNAARPAVHDLEPEDGNNDAAALWHAALTARASRRRAKLLVMVSDGSPTGSSVAALANLVRQLTTRRKMVCAQVAVRPVDDGCFPHYVLLEEDQIDECVRRFGGVVLKLVRQALRG